MEYCPYEISLHPKIGKKSKIPKIVIHRAAIKVANSFHEKEPNPKLHKKYNTTVEMGGMEMFMTFEFHYNKVFHVCNAKPTRGRKR